ncbi:MAG: hypothetical protein MHMPM18_000394 [Marteilia pararefringens]
MQEATERLIGGEEGGQTAAMTQSLDAEIVENQDEEDNFIDQNISQPSENHSHNLQESVESKDGNEMSEKENRSSSEKVEPAETKSKATKELFNCNICFETVTSPVVTDCGHLFCWPCIYQWMEMANGNSCPCCNANISTESINPIYGHDVPNNDPRNDVPERPTKARDDSNYQARTSTSSFRMSLSFGVGAFPFGFFESAFDIHQEEPNGEENATSRPLWRSFISKFLQWGTIISLLYIFGS